MKNNCEYCNGINRSLIFTSGEYEDGYTGVPHHEEAEVYIDKNKLILAANVEVTFLDEHALINYCPMCGRKLKKEQENETHN